MTKKYGNNARPGDPRPTINVKELQAEIVQRRIDGVTWPQIVEQLDISLGYAYKLYKKALAEIIREPVKELVKIETQKLDELEHEARKILFGIHYLVSSGSVVRDTVDTNSGKPMLDDDGNPVLVKLKDISPKLQAIDKILKIQERRAKLLGLDKPTKVAQTNPAGDKEPSWARFYLPHNGRDENVEIEQSSETAHS